MDTFVVRITPRRIERIVFFLIILFFIITTVSYANRYYDTTSEDVGYLDKIFSGTFFAEIPTDAGDITAMVTAKSTTQEVNLTEPEVNDTIVTENIVNDTVESTENDTADDTNSTESEPEPIKCTKDYLDLKSFNTEEYEGSSTKEGTIEKINLQYCNTGDKSNYMISEIYIWDEADEDNDLVDTRKKIPFYTTPKTMMLESGEKYLKTYSLDPVKSIWKDSEFNYVIKFYFVDKDGEKLNATYIKAVSGTYTI